MENPAVNAPPHRFDVVVAGAGIVGLALALSIRQSGAPRAGVLVCDPALDPTRAGPRNLRAVAIAAGSRRLLERLGVWPAIAPAAQPIAAIVLTDAPNDAMPRPVFLDFSGEAAPGEPFAHMVFVDDLHAALLAACRSAGVVLRPHGLAEIEVESTGVILRGLGEPAPTTRLLVAADGGRSRLREQAGIKTIGWDYRQSAVVATLAHERHHGGRAVQHFLPGGPLALLPMRADDGSPRRSSIVWTERQPEAERLVGLDGDAFVAELRDRIGHELGQFRLEDRPTAHRLRVSLARQLAGARLALVGDAARTIHPLAGQGLNLGLKDAVALSALVTRAIRLGLDPGAPALLANYQQARRADTTAMAIATDLLNRLFSNDNGPLRAIRDIGLGLVDRAPGLKRWLIEEAAGTPAAGPSRHDGPSRPGRARRQPAPSDRP